MDFTDAEARVDEQLAKQCTAMQSLKFEFMVLIFTVHVLYATIQSLTSATSQLIQSIIKTGSGEYLV